MPPTCHSSTGRSWHDHDQVFLTRKVEDLTCAPLMLLVSSWKKERERPLVSASYPTRTTSLVFQKEVFGYFL